MKIYKLSKEAITDYRKGAKRYKGISKRVLIRRISALINNAVAEYKDNYTIYRFGAFKMVYNKELDIIQNVYWDSCYKGIKIDEDIINNLKRDYYRLGLDDNGTTVIRYNV